MGSDRDGFALKVDAEGVDASRKGRNDADGR